MTGMERNSEVVQMAAYAPLLANVNHKGALCPTNLVIYDNSRYACPCLTKTLNFPELHCSIAVFLQSCAGHCPKTAGELRSCDSSLCDRKWARGISLLHHTCMHEL